MARKKRAGNVLDLPSVPKTPAPAVDLIEKELDREDELAEIRLLKSVRSKGGIAGIQAAKMLREIRRECKPVRHEPEIVTFENLAKGNASAG